MAEGRVSYKIMAHVDVLEKNALGWTKEVNGSTILSQAV